MNARMIVAVALGGAVGALVRAGVTNHLVTSRSVGLLILNVAGSFVLGLLVIRLVHAPTLLAATGTGFCGAVTSMSTFAVDVAQRLQDGQAASALGLACLTVAGALAGAAVGLRLGEPR